MIIVHAAASGASLALWGEAPEEPSATGSRRRGRTPKAKTKAARPPAMRFDAGPDRLRAALVEGLPDLDVAPDDLATWVAWLPSGEHGALPSSPLVAESAEKASRIDPWDVSAVALAPEQAVEALSASIGRTTWAPGVIVGPTLAYWATVFRFAAALVARQQYLPGVANDPAGTEYRACWEPVLVGTDLLHARQLVRVMPHAARALGRDPVAAPPSKPASAVFEDWLGAMVDHLVRTSVSVARDGRGRPARAPRFETIHDQWMHALRAPEGRLTGDPDELARLAVQVRQWRRPIEIATASPFRLCFRLEEPETNDDGAPRDDLWYVRYLFQAADDPSLLVPADQAWDARGRQAAILRRGGFQPREFLLAMLGQASSLSTAIEESLKSPAPAGYVLNSTGAHEFLTEKAALLEQSGFGVFLPAWWSRKGTKLRLSARAVIKSPKLTSKAEMSLNDILNFQWEIALGDQTLTLAELKALARLKTPLVRVRGQWVQLSAEEIEAALAFWKTKGDAGVSARQAIQMALGVARVPGGLAFEGVRADGWIGDLVQQLQSGGGFETFDPPAGFVGTLRPYQTRGYSWLGFLRRWGFGACLADDMGLGKTVQTLASIQRDWHEAKPRQRRPTLLICPMSVVGNWQKEAARFTPDLPVLVHHGLSRTKGAEFKKLAARHALVLSSYSLLHRDFALFKPVSWAGAILDEAQNIKNPQTKQAQAARAVPADYRVALTGTPVENHVGDLWSIMEFLNPGWLGTQAEFKRTFHIPIQAQRDPEAARRLQRLTGPFILRRLKTDKSIIADLPEKLEMKVFCTLTREQGSLYTAVVEETARALEDSEGIQRKGLVLATLSKLKQVCNHPAQFLGDNSAIAGRSGKLARLTEMLDEALDAGDRALIFSQFSEMGAILRRHLQETFGREVLFLHGSVPKPQRDTLVERFQSPDPDAPRLFILSLKAGGTGLNLTAANHVFHFDRWWNPAVENQATDRAFRIGQTRRVQVHKFVCVGTLEEKIDEMIERKQAIAGTVVGSGEDWLTKLSNDELRDLFTLRSEALEE